MIVVIGPEDIVRAEVVIRYVEVHFYMFGELKVLGYVREYQLLFSFGVRCVFSFTMFNGKRYRHLSMSLHNGVPSPALAECVAKTLFGFKKDWADWAGGISEADDDIKDKVVVLVEEV